MKATLFVYGAQAAILRTKSKVEGGYMGCQSGWVESPVNTGAMCFKFIGKFPSEEGYYKCSDIDAALPLPKSEEENRQYRDGFDATGATDGVLLGANDLIEEGKFVDTQNNTLTWSNWYWREPNNSPHFEACCGGEDFVQMNNPFFPETEDAHLGWNDIPSNFGSQVVCVRALEFIPTSAPSTTTSTAASSTNQSTETSSATTTTVTTSTTTTKATTTTPKTTSKQVTSTTASGTSTETTTTTTKSSTTKTSTTSTTTKKVKIRNIFDMSSAVLPNPAEWIDYGCASRGHYDAFEQIAGIAVDVADRAFASWKHCYRCSTDNDPTKIVDYDYDLDNDSCVKSTKESRSLCECDRKLVSVLLENSPNSSYANFDKNNCSTGTAKHELRCCNYKTHMWEGYNALVKTCCSSGVKEIGSC